MPTYFLMAVLNNMGTLVPEIKPGVGMTTGPKQAGKEIKRVGELKTKRKKEEEKKKQ